MELNLDEGRPRFGLWVMLLLALFLGTTLVYGVAYIYFSETAIITPSSRIRAYESEWMEWVFTPGVRVESLLTGDEVVVGRFHRSRL